MNTPDLLPVKRFIQTLQIVHREGRHLIYSWNQLYSQPVDAEWVKSLEHNPDLAVEMEAFVSRFGRMQDTIADKLLPRWLMALAETPGSQIETLNRAERLGVIASTEAWLAARKLRNMLVHEYMDDPKAFADALMQAKEHAMMLIETFNRLREYADHRMALQKEKLPPALAV